MCVNESLFALLLGAAALGAAPSGPSVQMVRVSDRTAFFRFEPAASVQIAVRNVQKVPWRAARLRLSMSGQESKEVLLPDLAPGATHEVTWGVNTRLRPDRYLLRARFRTPGEPEVEETAEFPITIVARPLPRVMPVLMWGGGSTEQERRLLKETGFTHYLLTMGEHARAWKARGPIEAEPSLFRSNAERLDTALAEQLYVYGYVYPGRWARTLPGYERVGRDGKPYAVESKHRDICALVPEMEKLCGDVGRSIAQSYGRFPALQGFDIHSETRDSARPCFHPADREAFRRSAGIEIPTQIENKTGVAYAKLADFPADRVIPDDHPIYRYYQWYWKEGDGWVRLNDAVHEGLKSGGRTDWRTYYGPATRVASVYGGGGKLDAVSNWTYVYPEPLGIGLNCDELLAVAKGSGRGQAVTMGIQIICYRSQLAPVGRRPGPGSGSGSAWEDADPDAAYITVPPMCLREGFWAAISRPLDGLIHHGIESLFATGRSGAYRYTHPGTQHELKRLLQEVVCPLGPMLLQVPDAAADVAFLESFASQVFAGRGTWGWGRGWEGSAYQVLQHAQLQPEVFYEETVLRRGLDGVRILVAPNCDVLPQSVAAKVRQFQARGGILVADERLCPALKPDVTLEAFDRSIPSKDGADRDKAKILDRAAALRKAIDGRYSRWCDSSNPEVVTRRRRYGDADYVFVVNDHRQFGDYVGRYRTTMEEGLPSEATISIRRPGAVVYDLITRQEIPTEAIDGVVRFPVRLGPCEGRLFLLLPRRIAAISVRGPERISRLQHAEINLSVEEAPAGETSRRPAAIIPVSVQIRDPEGRLGEGSGYYGAKDGLLRIGLDVAANDTAGRWQIHAEELASGRTAVWEFQVND